MTLQNETGRKLKVHDVIFHKEGIEALKIDATERDSEEEFHDQESKESELICRAVIKTFRQDRGVSIKLADKRHGL